MSSWWPHDRRCDRDLCHPDCPIRRRAEQDDRPYPGSTRCFRCHRRLLNYVPASRMDRS